MDEKMKDFELQNKEGGNSSSTLRRERDKRQTRFLTRKEDSTFAIYEKEMEEALFSTME